MGRVRAALAGGGGKEAGGAILGSRATHVVCRPEHAAKWLAAGTPLCAPHAWWRSSLADFKR